MKFSKFYISKKFLAALVGVTVILLDGILDLGLSQDTLDNMKFLISAYLIAQGIPDAVSNFKVPNSH